jgi:hypothetical protein
MRQPLVFRSRPGKLLVWAESGSFWKLGSCEHTGVLPGWRDGMASAGA